MNVLVVYESMYGNTARIAEAIGAGLRERVPVEVREMAGVTDIPTGLDLLVVGGPTYAHGVESAMKAFLDRIPEGSLAGVAATSFDTRLDWPKFISGAASKGIGERLAHKGARTVATPESFRVQDKDGPLLEGEVERATAWGRELATLLTPVAAR